LTTARSTTKPAARAEEASFADRALGAAPSPLDRIDQLFQQTPRRIWWGVVALAVLIALGVVWTTVVQRVVTLQSQAVMLPPDGLFPIADPQTGQIEDVGTRVGATGGAGKTLAVVLGPDKAKQPIPSPIDAKVVVQNVRNNEVVAAGTSLFVLAPAKQKVVAIGLFPAGAVSALKPGESATVAINGVSSDSYGQVRATVHSVGAIPLQSARVAQLTGDPALAGALAQQGPLYEVMFNLKHADTPSGLQWTHGDGPADQIPIGALAAVTVVVDRQALISGVF
jgi:hypothetical protein